MVLYYKKITKSIKIKIKMIFSIMDQENKNSVVTIW